MHLVFKFTPEADAQATLKLLEKLTRSLTEDTAPLLPAAGR